MRIHRHRLRKAKYQTQKYRINERIQVPSVRVIDQNGQMLGVMPTTQALELASTQELDLIEVSPKAEPPVCKLLDFGQFRYQKEKEVKKQRAQAKEVELKTVRLSIRIGEHDFSVRLKQAQKFLERGDKVRVELPLRGRERSHRDVANDVIERFFTSLRASIPVKMEQQPTFQAGRLSLIVAPENTAA